MKVLMLQSLLLLLLMPLTNGSSSDDWRPQGRFGKRRGSSSEFTPDTELQQLMSPFRGKNYDRINHTMALPTVIGLMKTAC